MITYFIKIGFQALKAVGAYKLRTFFCSLSIALGVGAVTVIVATIEGAYHRAYEIIDQFGPDSVLIFGGSQQKRVAGIRERTLTLRDVREIKTSSPTAYLVVPMTSKGNVTVSYKNRRHQTRVIGSTDQYSISWTWPIQEGTDFTEYDVKRLRNVCLVGTEIVDTLFFNESPIGKFITVDRLPCEVIGILSERGASAGGHNLDDRIIMPLTTVMRKLLNESEYISAIRVRYTDDENLPYWVRELEKILRNTHRLGENEPDDFRVISPNEIVRFLVTFTGSLVAYLTIVGIISLVVSGFVIANLFLISVTERRHEIGIRRASGASKRDVFSQFLIEIFLIATIGAFSGYFIGLLISLIIQTAGEFTMHFSYRAFLGGVTVSWIIGFLFGLNPARQASELNPIEAIKL